MERTIAQHERINYNIIGKITNKLTIFPDSQSSKSRARLTQARLLHNFKQGHEWIEHNHMFKTPLLKYLKICMDLSVATCLHGIKIAAEQGLKSAISRSLVCMLVLVTTLIKKIHGKHLYKDGMAWFKTHVGLMYIRCTHQSWQK